MSGVSDLVPKWVRLRFQFLSYNSDFYYPEENKVDIPYYHARKLSDKWFFFIVIDINRQSKTSETHYEQERLS